MCSVAVDRGAGPQTTAGTVGADAAISRVLRWGVVTAGAIILIGVALFVAHAGMRAVLLSPEHLSGSSEQDPHALRVVLHELLPPQAAAVTDVGLILLMATPVVSVAVAAVTFAVRRDWLYLVLAGFVFTMLMVGFAVGRT
jgi:uncharacterized membrane protein